MSDTDHHEVTKETKDTMNTLRESGFVLFVILRDFVKTRGRDEAYS